MTEDPAPTTPAPPARRTRNRIGVLALILALIAAVAPLVIWIVMLFVGIAEYPDDADSAVYVGVLGGMIFFFGSIALLSPLSFAAVVLGVISMWRPGGKAPGIVAIVLGVIGSFGLFGFPFVLGELVPGW